MKTLKYIVFCMLTVLFTTACNEGIDPITPVSPGADEAAPTLTIKYPTPNLKIIDLQPTISINFQADASDDIELACVSVNLNGSEIKKYDSFKDYRRYSLNHIYELGDGDYTLTITAEDLTGKKTSSSVSFSKSSRYEALYPGEIFYMPFDDNLKDLISDGSATKVGFPVFAGGHLGLSYKGVADGYVTFPATNLLNKEFSAAFWYKLNATPDRSGIMTVSADNPDMAADAKNDRRFGFRLFREAGNGGQTFKLNVGNGEGDSWFDGGASAMLDPATTGADWVFMAFTISDTKCVVYINGKVVCEGAFGGVSWAGCQSISIMSGAPYFVEWSHRSDESLMDELRIFNKALSVEEINTMYNDQK